MEISLKSKTAIVTGGAQGIGKGITLELRKCGAAVTVLDRNEETLNELTKEYPDIKTVLVDLGDWDATEKAMKSALPADLLVNNAGVGLLSTIPEITKEDFDRVFSINVRGAINITRLFVEDLLTRKSAGSIVNISSQASQAGLPNHAVYCASKGAIDAFTRAAAFDLGPNQIRINSVNPTVVNTDLGKEIWKDPAVRKPMMDGIPLGRFAEISDVVNTVIFLLSDQASMIHGVCLPVDGGFLAV